MSMYASFAYAEAAYRRERIAASFRHHPATTPAGRNRSGRMLGLVHRDRAATTPRSVGVPVGPGRLVH